MQNGIVYKGSNATNDYVGSSTRDLETRVKEHKDKPTSTKMANWLLKGTDIKWAIVDTFTIINEKELLQVEYEWIAKLDPARCLNSKGNKAEVETIGDPIVIDYSRFKITNETKKKRFRIQWRDREGEKQIENFPYAKRSQELAKTEAETRRAQLVKQYFI